MKKEEFEKFNKEDIKVHYIDLKTSTDEIPTKWNDDELRCLLDIHAEEILEWLRKKDSNYFNWYETDSEEFEERFLK